MSHMGFFSNGKKQPVMGANNNNNNNNNKSNDKKNTKKEDPKKAAREASKKNANYGKKVNKVENAHLKCRRCKPERGVYCGKHAGLSRLHAKERYNISADDPDFLDKI